MITVTSPLAGWVTPLDAVPDPVFSERMLGEGIAIDPVDGRLVAPAAGIVETVHEAGHAVTLALDGGPVLLMHIGLDTVALGGKGFAPKVKSGQRVAAGDTLIEFDLDQLARRARSVVTPMILTNGEAFCLTNLASEGPIAAGDPLLEIDRMDDAAFSFTKVQPSVSRPLHLKLAHGLHARPAARLAKLASSFDAEAELVASDGRAAPVRSPVAMLGLGLRHGVPIVIRAGGPDAEQAVAALSDLLESGMGELLAVSKSGAAMHLLQEARELPPELRGICAVPGMAIGPAWHLKNQSVEVAEDAHDMELERASLNAALERVAAQLRIEAQAGAVAGAIAEAHLAMIADPMLDEMAQQLVSSGKTAAFAWRSAIQKFAAPLRKSNDPRFKERLDDLLDLERRLLRELTGDNSAEARPPEKAILVAETLYPSQLKELAEAGIAGIATAAGGATSHASIIAAGLALPMLVGLGPKLALVEEGTELILRGDTLVIAPDAQRLSDAKVQAKMRSERQAAAEARAHQPGVTADGTRIEVFANLGSAAEAGAAVAQGAEGCGLLRTEFLFLDRDAPPDEAEQRQAYQLIADALGERPLIVRTLDIGADKPAPWLPMEAEDNPALGLRGIRLQLIRKDLLETQLRALLGVRASGPLRIMLPMVSTVAELRQSKSVLERLASEAEVEPPELGIMVETPAAALISGVLAEEAAFFSIGSNDLSQYALARDRTNPAVAKDLDGLDPAVLRLIAETVRGAQIHGRVTGVCGSLAAVPEAIPVLIGLGVSELSVPSGAIAEVKAILRSLVLSHCREVANQALAASDADNVRALVAPILEQRA